MGSIFSASLLDLVEDSTRSCAGTMNALMPLVAAGGDSWWRFLPMAGVPLTDAQRPLHPERQNKTITGT
ncbi:MAG: hypothetical protein SOR95_10390 [Sutterella sp.]|nr:hypothetical protein [Sutterella sp.]